MLRKKRKRKNRLKRGSRNIWDILLHPLFKIFVSVVLTMGIVTAGSIMLYRALQRTFTINKIVVSGNRHLTGGDIIALARIRRGESLLSVRSARIERSLMKSPWIKDVSIRKELPGTIIIRLREAEPVAILKKKKGLYIISREGVVLDRIKERESFLPVITLKRNDKTLLREVIRLARVIKRDNLFNDRKVEIRAGRQEDITLVVDDLIIKVGKGDYKKKLLRLLEIEKQIMRRGIPVEYIDLRFSRRVIVHPVKERING